MPASALGARIVRVLRRARQWYGRLHRALTVLFVLAILTAVSANELVGTMRALNAWSAGRGLAMHLLVLIVELHFAVGLAALYAKLVLAPLRDDLHKATVPFADALGAFAQWRRAAREERAQVEYRWHPR